MTHLPQKDVGIKSRKSKQLSLTGAQLLCRGEVEPPWAVSQGASPWWWPRAEDLVIIDMQASLFLFLLEEG